MELMKFSGTPVADSAAINELLARYGVKFGIYKNGVFKEQLFPFDAIPRVISTKDFSSMEKGLIQRVDALNLFLKDIYSEGKIIKDGVFKEIQGYTYGVQLASFYQQGDFLPHVKLMETGFTHHSDMTDFGLPYAFVRTPRPYDTTTLNYNWQIWNTKAFSLYTNATDNIDESSAKAAVDAIIRFMVRRGIIRTRVSSGYVTEIISEDWLLQVHSPVSGICRSYVETGDEVRCGDLLCEITDPLEGNVISKIFALVSGTVFFRYNRLLEFEKSVLFKIIRL